MIFLSNWLGLPRSTLNPSRAVLGTTHDIDHLLLMGTAKNNTHLRGVLGLLMRLIPSRAVLGTTHDIDHWLLIGTAKIHTRPNHRAVLGRTHDIDHLLLSGTAKIHTEPIHIVVYGQCLAALMIFAIYYWLGLPRSTLNPATSWSTGSAWPLSWYLPFTIDWIRLLLSCSWDCFRAHDIYPQLIGTACCAHVFETACRAHDIYHSYWLGLLAALMYLRLLATHDIYTPLIETACRAHVFETACRAHDTWLRLLVLQFHTACMPAALMIETASNSLGYHTDLRLHASLMMFTYR